MYIRSPKEPTFKQRSVENFQSSWWSILQGIVDFWMSCHSGEYFIHKSHLTRSVHRMHERKLLKRIWNKSVFFTLLRSSSEKYWLNANANAQKFCCYVNNCRTHIQQKQKLKIITCIKSISTYSANSRIQKSRNERKREKTRTIRLFLGS